jgi:spectinomycin phosphotransferase
VPELWLLDWDGVVVAPRERDLMFVVDGVLADAPVTAEQQSWFFDG